MRVLLADDDEFMRLLLEEVLRQTGHDPVVTADGEEAWEVFVRERPPMLVLDWQMPRLDGLALCRRVRASEGGDEPFVIVVTARDREEDLALVLDAGADDYMSKPVTPENLAARLRIATRRIAQAKARRQAEEELRRARYLAGIGETVIALRHEINNPLTALMAQASLLESGRVSGEASKSSATAILEQARRIAGVVARLAALDDPKTREYVPGQRMIDITGEHSTPGRS